ncbi:MAG: ABC transporter ATP-binding protein [Calditerrivibrio sp.]|nr:ABC transporter ATP-binding protein [Calditerrivibrio sp.]
MLTAKGITKSYNNNNNKVTVLKSINIAIDKGDFVTITGRSGSGKSTLLNVLSTLTNYDEGEIYFEQTLINHKNEKHINHLRRYDFAFIFQLYHLIPYLNALENVLLPFSYSIKKIDMNHIELGKFALDKVGLKGKYYRLPGELSGGEQQRVAIARGIVKKPKIVFADEPTGSLDEKTSAEIIELIQALNYEGMTIVMVTHEQKLAKLGNKTYVMEDGKITI